MVEESQCYIGALQLDEKKDTVASRLSPAMKRKLSIAIALCADSKVRHLSARCISSEYHLDVVSPLPHRGCGISLR